MIQNNELAAYQKQTVIKPELHHHEVQNIQINQNFSDKIEATSLFLESEQPTIQDYRKLANMYEESLQRIQTLEKNQKEMQMQFTHLQAALQHSLGLNTALKSLNRIPNTSYQNSPSLPNFNENKPSLLQHKPVTKTNTTQNVQPKYKNSKIKHKTSTFSSSVQQSTAPRISESHLTQPVPIENGKSSLQNSTIPESTQQTIPISKKAAQILNQGTTLPGATLLINLDDVNLIPTNKSKVSTSNSQAPSGNSKLTGQVVPANGGLVLNLESPATQMVPQQNQNPINIASNQIANQISNQNLVNSAIQNSAIQNNAVQNTVKINQNSCSLPVNNHQIISNHLNNQRVNNLPINNQVLNQQQTNSSIFSNPMAAAAAVSASVIGSTTVPTTVNFNSIQPSPVVPVTVS